MGFCVKPDDGGKRLNERRERERERERERGTAPHITVKPDSQHMTLVFEAAIFLSYVHYVYIHLKAIRLIILLADLIALHQCFFMSGQESLSENIGVRPSIA